MDFAREWTAFALEAEYEDFGPGRIVKAHNARLADLTRQLEDARQAEQRAHDRADHWTAEVAKLADQLAERTRERDEARYILAGSDYGSLPNDWTLPRVAEARMGDINKLTWQVRDTCARAESAERALAEARKDATEMRDAILAYADEYGELFGDDHPLRKVWMRLAAIDSAIEAEKGATDVRN